MLGAGAPSRCQERVGAEWSACAGWSPQFRVFVRGCLDLPAGVDDDHRPHSLLRGFPTEALPPALRKRRSSPKWIGPSAGLRWFALCGRARFNRMTDGPQEGRHLPRDGGGDYGLAFARRHQPAIARAQTQLSLPGDRPDDGRQALLSDLQRPAQASRVTIGPGALDQHPPRSWVASLGDGAAPDLLAG